MPSKPESKQRYSVYRTNVHVSRNACFNDENEDRNNRSSYAKENSFSFFSFLCFHGVMLSYSLEYS